MNNDCQKNMMRVFLQEKINFGIFFNECIDRVHFLCLLAEKIKKLVNMVYVLIFISIYLFYQFKDVTYGYVDVQHHYLLSSFRFFHPMLPADKQS